MFKAPKLPDTDPRVKKARQRYEAWRGILARQRAAIEAVEARKKGAEDTIQAAAVKALESGDLPQFSEMIQKAGATLAVCDAMLPKMREAHGKESRRDLSPEPRVVWKPKRLNDAPGAAIMSGEYVGHYPEG
jgi:hypothetical protein